MGKEMIVRKHVFPLPVPAGPWQWEQRWSNLLFMHWPVPKNALQGQVPVGLELDTWDNSPWVSLVAFKLERVRHRLLPSLGLVSNIIELNLRTYVLHRGEPAIYFLSIHADKRLAVALANWLTPLPYVRACMDFARNDAAYRFQCAGLIGKGKLEVDFTPRPQTALAPAGSLTEWLLERYGLFAVTPRGQLLRTVVQHSPWRIQDVALKLNENTIAEPFGLHLARPPELAHFSRGMDALIWPFAKLS